MHDVQRKSRECNSKKKKADIKNVKRNQRQKNREGAKPQRAPCRGHGRMLRGGAKRAAAGSAPDRRRKDSGARRGLKRRNVGQSQTCGHAVSPEMSMPRDALRLYQNKRQRRPHRYYCQTTSSHRMTKVMFQKIVERDMQKSETNLLVDMEFRN